MHDALNGAGVGSLQGKWEEMFGTVAVVMEEKVEKPVRERVTKKAGRQKTVTEKKTTRQKGRKKISQ